MLVEPVESPGLQGRCFLAVCSKETKTSFNGVGRHMCSKGKGASFRARLKWQQQEELARHGAQQPVPLERERFHYTNSSH